jgi:PAS domain S-box-containing protein
VEKIHSLLKRQIRKYFNDSLEVPKEWQGFIEMVNNAYHEFDTDRNMLERSLDLSSQELLQANTEMRVIFEAIPDLFFRLDYSGTILDCKTSTASDLYISRKELIGNKIYKIPIMPAAKRFKNAIEELGRTMAMVSIEYSLALQGEEHFYEARLVPALENEIIVVVRNVTERKTAENALRESEKKYRSIFENSVEGIFQTTPEGEFINANPSLARMFGYNSPEEMLKALAQTGGKQFVVPEDFARFKEIIEKYQILRGFETQAYGKDKNITWISINARIVKNEGGRAICYEGTIENINDRKRAEEALFESEEKYRSIIEESHIGVYIIQGGIFRFVNKTFCEILGYTHEEIIDRLSPRYFTLPEDLPYIEENLEKKHLGKAKKRTELTYRIRRKDGEIRTIKVIDSTILYKRKLATIGTLLDITKEKVLEQQLLRSQKLETVGRLAGGIAHDFNNMLGVILGNAQLARMNLPHEDKKVSKFFSEIEGAISQAAGFVRQLLAFSRRQVLELKTIDVNDLVANFEKMIHRIIGEHIEMSISYAPDLPMIKVDEAQINQILLNLVVNAREAMPAGGNLTIETSVTYIDEDCVALFPDASPGRYALLSVADTGVGMDKKIAINIFEPFFTTKDGGSGLGLSVVYGIVKQHGGFITVDSEVGKGTAFKVYLPSVEKTVEVTREKQHSMMAGNETILIVEDHDEYRKVEAAMLGRLGYKVYTASDGIEGVALFREKSKEIDLVILDAVMPKMSGRETLDEMKKACPSVPFLFVTGYSDGIHASYMPEKGIYILQKPYSLDALSQKIREIIERRK